MKVIEEEKIELSSRRVIDKKIEQLRKLPDTPLTEVCVLPFGQFRTFKYTCFLSLLIGRYYGYDSAKERYQSQQRFCVAGF